MMTELERRLLENRIDALLEPWRARPMPGISVGVAQGGALLAHRHAGLASLELGVPIGPQTRFRIASVSKQFTCAAILLLAERGRLDVEQPARSLLPELPKAYAGITVAQLMHNTSGIRDMLEIMRQGGADLGTPITEADLMAGICRQRTLNFTPGTRYLYSNSNFFLLGRIVEQLSGTKLAAFLEAEIFAPLGMTSTRHTPDLLVPLPNLASGYLAKGDGFIRAPHAFPLGGEGGLVSSVTDLLLWAHNRGTRQVPGAPVLAALERATPFVNGTANMYARGLVARPYRGHATFSHGGLWPGYRTEFLRVPGLDLAVVAISNNGASDPNLLAHRVLDIMLDGMGAPASPKLPPREALAAMAGRFMHEETGATLDITVAQDGTPTLSTNGVPTIAEATEDGRLTMPRGSSVFTVAAAGPDAVLVEQDAGITATWQRVPDGAVLPANLPGRYRSDEMNATWTIAPEADGMVVRAAGPVVHGPAWPVTPVTSADIRVHVPSTLMRAWLDVRVMRGADGAITELVVHGGRAKAVHFHRLPGG
jgi:CubicO group peptidase (beta-lactamase class C family)